MNSRLHLPGCIACLLLTPVPLLVGLGLVASAPAVQARAHALELPTESRLRAKTTSVPDVTLEISRGRRSDTGKGALVGGIAGAAFGALIGTLIRSEKWDEVDLPPAARSPAGAPLHSACAPHTQTERNRFDRKAPHAALGSRSA